MSGLDLAPSAEPNQAAPSEAPLSEAERMARLAPAVGKVRVVLDTDAFNEIDDQFAIVQMLLSPERMTVEAIYAAPFRNARADTPSEGMERSFEEIQRLLERLGSQHEGRPPRLVSPARAANAAGARSEPKPVVPLDV